MAAIIRVKRRLDEDPAESLIVQYKKRRSDGTAAEETAKFCLNLVTTVKTKDDAVSRHIQRTLRRQQLQTNFKTHESQRTQQTRAEKRASAKASRYKIVNSKRTLPADTEAEDTTAENPPATGRLEQTGVNGTSGQAFSSDSDTVSGSSGGASPSTSNESVAVSTGDIDTPSSGDSVIHVYDVEHDHAEDSLQQQNPLSQPAMSGITLNGQVMVSRPAPSADSNFVYDLYYINNDRQHYDFRDLENFLSIEAFHDEMTSLSDRQEECGEVYDDDDDSNDEGNWRNDYPDHDPDEDEEDEDFIYGMDHDELEREGSRSYCNTDEMFLADTLGTRLHLFGESSDEVEDSDDDSDAGRREARWFEDEGDDDGVRGSSYEAFMRRVKRDLAQDDNGGDSDND